MRLAEIGLKRTAEEASVRRAEADAAARRSEGEARRADAEVRRVDAEARRVDAEARRAQARAALPSSLLTTEFVSLLLPMERGRFVRETLRSLSVSPGAAAASDSER